MTPVQTAVISNLSKRQLNSLRTLQAKVEVGSYMGVRVSPAQIAAMQAAFTIAKSTGEPLPAEALKAAALFGLK
jgi:hypothetical protein